MEIRRPRIFNTLTAIPRSIWVLSIANFLINIATIITFSYTPFFLIAAFGISRFSFGIIEGIVEGTSWLMRIVSGILSDVLRRRKFLIVIGYGLIALARPLFAFANSILMVFSGRMIDRIANGLQASPREALTTDLAPPNLKGACFGLRQACGWIGSVVGALIGVTVMSLTNNYRLLFAISAIPAVIAVAIVACFVKDVNPKEIKSDAQEDWRIHDIKRLPKSYWLIVAVSSVYMMARFSESFISMWAKHLGLKEAYVAVVIAIINLASAFASYPVGVLSDRIDRRVFVGAGLVTIVISHIMFASANSIAMIIFSSVFWGIQMGVTQSLLVTMVADRAPRDLRGTAFGIYFLTCGVAMMLASPLAGWLSDTYGQHSAFIAGAGFSLLALFGLCFVSSSRKKASA